MNTQDGAWHREDDPAQRRERVSAEPGDGSLPRTEAIKDERVRRWDVATPGATQIGRPESPDGDLSERIRRLHDERHPAMAGHSERMHRLDKLRISHALCSRLDLTPWERDRVLGIMLEIDLTEFGSQRAIPTVALVVIQHVVDRERQRQLGLDDPERLSELTPDEMDRLYELFTSITDEEPYQELLADRDLTVTNVNRLDRVLKNQLEERDAADSVLGHQPDRDPHIPLTLSGKSVSPQSDSDSPAPDSE
jgi:hypothetical protein